MKVLCYNHTKMKFRVKDLEVGHQSVGWIKSGMMLGLPHTNCRTDGQKWNKVETVCDEEVCEDPLRIMHLSK